MVFPLFVGKNAIFPTIKWGEWGIRDPVQLPKYPSPEIYYRRYVGKFSSEGNANDRHCVKIYSEFDFGPMAYTFFLEIGQDFPTLIYIKIKGAQSRYFELFWPTRKLPLN